MSVNPSKRGPWIQRAVCPCGWHEKAPYGNPLYIRLDVCPECGTPKERWSYGVSYWNWKVKTMRWVSTSVWWRPSTWGTGYWEERGANHDR